MSKCESVLQYTEYTTDELRTLTDAKLRNFATGVSAKDVTNKTEECSGE